MVDQIKVETHDATIYANNTKGSRYVTLVWKWKNSFWGETWCVGGPEVVKMRSGEKMEQFLGAVFPHATQWGPVTGLPGHR